MSRENLLVHAAGQESAVNDQNVAGDKAGGIGRQKYDRSHEIFHSADPEQPAGMVAGFGRLEGRPLLLAEVKLAALESGTLHLGSAQGAVLTPRPLPYAIGEPE